MSRKRSGQDAGIKIHVKREDFESGRDVDDEGEGDKQEISAPAPQIVQQQQQPLTKKKAHRPWRTATGNVEVANPFAGTSAAFGGFAGFSSLGTSKSEPSSSTLPLKEANETSAKTGPMPTSQVEQEITKSTNSGNRSEQTAPVINGSEPASSADEESEAK